MAGQHEGWDPADPQDPPDAATVDLPRLIEWARQPQHGRSGVSVGHGPSPRSALYREAEAAVERDRARRVRPEPQPLITSDPYARTQAEPSGSAISAVPGASGASAAGLDEEDDEPAGPTASGTNGRPSDPHPADPPLSDLRPSDPPLSEPASSDPPLSVPGSSADDLPAAPAPSADDLAHALARSLGDLQSRSAPPGATAPDEPPVAEKPVTSWRRSADAPRAADTQRPASSRADGVIDHVAIDTPARPRPGSLADLRRRLQQLPPGHPSSPYHDDGSLKPQPLRIKQLELAPPGRWRSADRTRGTGHDPAHDRAGAADRITATYQSRLSAPGAAAFQVPDTGADVAADRADDTEPHTPVGDGHPVGQDHPASQDQAAIHDSPADHDQAAIHESAISNGSAVSQNIAASHGEDQPVGQDSYAADDRAADGWPPAGQPARYRHDATIQAARDAISAMVHRTATDARPDRSLPRGHSTVPGLSLSPSRATAPDGGEPRSHGLADSVPRQNGAGRPEPPPDPDEGEGEPQAGRTGPRAEPDGSWRWGPASLSADQARAVGVMYDRFRAAEGRNLFGSYANGGLTDALRMVAERLDHGRLATDAELPTLVSLDLFMAEVAAMLNRYPSAPVEELCLHVTGALVYGFVFDEAQYTTGTWLVHDALRLQGFRLDIRRNGWHAAEHKYVITAWFDPSLGVPFQLQFHTAASLAATRLSRASSGVLADPRTPAGQAADVRSEIATAWAAVVAPAGISQIGDYRRNGR